MRMRTRVKICGITRAVDARRACDLGASAIGFVFWSRSPRYVDPGAARKIIETLPADVAAVGVFVDPTESEVRQVADEARLGVIQLHGEESPEFCRRLSYRVLKAMGVSAETAVKDVLAWPADVTVLLDAHDPERKGGTGRTIDWTLAARVAATRRIFLSGGLTADNVGEAIRVVRPYGIDVSSGVEHEPGVKDENRLCALFEAVHDASGLTAGSRA